MKVAIVGSAPSSNSLAPYGDESWEVWGMNEQYEWLPRWDRWFDIHQDRIIKNGLVNAKHYDWLKVQTKPVVTGRPYPEIPGNVVFPLQEAKERFGDYFTNTVSYQIAYALILGAEQIGVWGVDMACDSEYGEQRASCEYFLGLARGLLGKDNVIVPGESDLLKTPYLYGIEEMPEILLKARSKMLEMKGRMEQTRAQSRQLELQAAYETGAYDQATYYYKNWAINGLLIKPI